MKGERMAKILYAASTASHIKSFHLPYIDALRAEGHTVLTMANGEGVDFDIPFTKRLISLKNARARRSVKAILKAENFDAVILNTALAAFHIRLAMPKRNRPRTLNIVHGYLFKKQKNGIRAVLFRICERLVRKKTDEILVMNSEDKEIAERCKLSRGGVSMIFGMGASAKPALSEREALLSEFDLRDKFVITFVGELSKRKNQQFLISALPEIKIHIPAATLCLVGDGAEREELVRLAERLLISDSVVFTGHRADACDFIRLSELYVSASFTEGMPFNIIEALGIGKTVIASDIKGHRDLLSGGAGFLYKSGDIAEFVSLVNNIYENKITPDKSTVQNTYLDYSFERVFPETLKKIKEALLLEAPIE